MIYPKVFAGYPKMSILIEGPQGIGKSLLASEIARLMTAYGWRVEADGNACLPEGLSIGVIEITTSNDSEDFLMKRGRALKKRGKK